MPLATNIVAYYKLEDTSDSVASFTLTNNNSVTFSAAKINNGANLGAANTNKFLNIANKLGIDGGAFTFSCWVKLLAEINSGVFRFVTQASNTSDTVLSIRYDYNSGTRVLRLERTKGGVGNDLASYTVTLGTSSFYHIAGTYDGSTLTLYVNGTSQATQASSGSGSSGSTEGFVIGARPDGTQDFASALIDEVGVWSRALSAPEISSLYNSGSGLQYPFGTTYARAALVSVSNAASRLAVASRTFAFIRVISASTSRSATRSITAVRSMIFKRSLSASVSNAVSRLAAAARTRTFTRLASVVVSNAANRLATVKVFLNGLLDIYSNKYSPRGTTYSDKYTHLK